MAIGLALLVWQGPEVEAAPAIEGNWCHVVHEREGVGCFSRDEGCVSFLAGGEALLPDSGDATATWQADESGVLLRVQPPEDEEGVDYYLLWSGEELIVPDGDGEELMRLARQGAYPACSDRPPEVDRDRTNQAKRGLRDIQIALERYAVEHHGAYPLYIWGGSVESWSCHLSEDCSTPREQIPDPLLAEGFVDAYPENPFTMWQPVCDLTSDDPRFGCLPGDGVRAADGSGLEARGLMSNTLSDPRVPASRAPAGHPYYYADDGDPYTQDYLPGQFIYRALVLPVEIPGGCPPEGCPQQAIGYILALYGSLRNDGRDWLHCLDAQGEFGPIDQTPNCSPDDLWEAEASGLAAMGDFGYADIVFRPCPDTDPTDPRCTGGMTTMHPDGSPDGLVIFYSSGADYDPPIGPGHGWTPAPPPAPGDPEA